MNNPATTSEWIGRRRLRASVDRTLGVKVPKAVFDEAEAYARRKMAFQNEALILEWPRRSARASRRQSSIPYLKAATSSSAPSAVPTLHGPKPESRVSVQSADNP